MAAAEPGTLKPGKTIDRYRLVQNLSGTGLWTSWLATDSSDGQQYVVKLTAAERDDRRLVGYRERLETLTNLAHPALALPSRVFYDQGFLAYARCYQEQDGLSEAPAADLHERINHAIRIAEALHVLHRSDLTHGAVSSANIRIGDNVRLVDIRLDSHGGERDDLTGFAEVITQWLQDLPDDHPRYADGLLQLPPRLSQLQAAFTNALENQAPLPSALQIRDALEDAKLQWQRMRTETVIPTTPEDHDLDALPWANPPAATAATSAAPATGRRRTGVIAGLGLLLVGALLAVVVWLPKLVEQPTAPTVSSPPVQKTAAEEPAEPEPLTEEQLAQLFNEREEAQAVLDDLIQLRLELDARKVTLWANKAFEQALTVKAAGDQAFRDQQFVDASQHYRQALDQMTAIQDRTQAVIDTALADGWAAFDRGDAEAAKRHFGLVLEIDAEHSDALNGMRRAETLDQVLELAEQAQRAEKEELWADARSYYRDIMNLDPDTDGVEAAIERLTGIINNIAFQDHMSDGLSALDAGRLAAAESAFLAARRLKPGSAGPSEGLQEINRRRKESGLQQHRSQILTLEREENWAEATAGYQRLLDKDPNLQFAKDGIVEARERAALDAALQNRLQLPERWWNAEGRNEVSALLAEARAIRSGGPKLQRQITELDRALDQAKRQVSLYLQSDTLCDVVVYKVARLGQFESTELQLYPGRYTVVGTRDGFRDVRKDVLVSPSPGQQSVEIRCNDEV